MPGCTLLTIVLPLSQNKRHYLGSSDATTLCASEPLDMSVFHRGLPTRADLPNWGYPDAASARLRSDQSQGLINVSRWADQEKMWLDMQGRGVEMAITS